MMQIEEDIASRGWATQVQGDKLLELLEALYHINEAMKIMEGYNSENLDKLEEARNSLVQYLHYLEVKDYEWGTTNSKEFRRVSITAEGILPARWSA